MRVLKTVVEILGSIILVLLIALLAGQASALQAQDFSQTIQKTSRFSSAQSQDNHLKIYNIHGSVTVRGYNGDEIRITAYQEIEGTRREVKQGREELEFKVESDGNFVIVYIDAPFIEIDKEGDDIDYRIDRWDEGYDFLYDIEIEVPRETNLYASTINRGSIEISGTTGTITAKNVNGKVTLEDITGTTRARTVNGDITARYNTSPTDDSDYKTVNGTIEVYYPKSLGADIRFKSLHGELYTDFQKIERLQSRVKQDRKEKHGKVRYRVDKFAPIRIGDGGPVYNFEVLNGDVYIKQIQ